MPVYEYKCGNCGKEFEELVSVTQQVTPPCPSCGSALTEKKVSAPSGFSKSGGSSCGSSGFA